MKKKPKKIWLVTGEEIVQAELISKNRIHFADGTEVELPEDTKVMVIYE